MNFKTFLQYYNIIIPLSLVCITKVCVDSFSYFPITKDSMSWLKMPQNRVKLEMIWGVPRWQVL